MFVRYKYLEDSKLNSFRIHAFPNFLSLKPLLTLECLTACVLEVRDKGLNNRNFKDRCAPIALPGLKCPLTRDTQAYRWTEVVALWADKLYSSIEPNCNLHCTTSLTTKPHHYQSCFIFHLIA